MNEGHVIKELSMGMLTEKSKLTYNYMGRGHSLNRFDRINNNF